MSHSPTAVSGGIRQSLPRGSVAVSSREDRVVLAAGDGGGQFLRGTVGEGSDVSSLELLGIRRELLATLIATGEPGVVVLVNGRPYNRREACALANAVREG